jgi:hypothetical protein
MIQLLVYAHVSGFAATGLGPLPGSMQMQQGQGFQRRIMPPEQAAIINTPVVVPPPPPLVIANP